MLKINQRRKSVKMIFAAFVRILNMNTLKFALAILASANNTVLGTGVILLVIVLIAALQIALTSNPHNRRL